MNQKVAAPELSNTTKAYAFTNVEELITITNGQLEDTLYIADDVFIPEKKNIGRCYRSDFSLKTKEEAEAILDTQKAIVYNNNQKSDFFVYNERTGELLPFKKNDYLIYDRGYFAFDGENYISYDDNGIEIGKFSFEMS